MDTTVKKRILDFFLWVAFLLPGAVMIAFDIQVSCHPDDDFTIALLLVFLIIVWLIVTGILICIAVWWNCPKKAMLLALSIFFFLGLAPMLLRTFPIGHYVHLAQAYPEYQARIQASPGKRLKFDWGGGGWAAGPSFDRALVYDPTDTLLQENKIKDAQRRKQSSYKSGQETHDSHRLSTKHLYGHFYLVEYWYT